MRLQAFSMDLTQVFHMVSNCVGHVRYLGNKLNIVVFSGINSALGSPTEYFPSGVHCSITSLPKKASLAKA